MQTTREVRLADAATARLELVDTVPAEPGPNQVLVRNRAMALRAVMGLLLDGGVPGLPGYRPGRVLWGPAIGEVTAGALPSGTVVSHLAGWREYAVLDVDQVRILPPGTDHILALSQAELAHVALSVAPLDAGETVLVSSAAGSIGSTAARVARLLGAGRVVGTASAGKLPWVTGEAGYDAAVDRNAPDLPSALRRAAPDGIDVVLDLTGGELTRAALDIAEPNARVLAIGTLAARSAPAGIDLTTLISRRITLRGFTPRDHPAAVDHARRELADRSRQGLIPVPHTVFDGLDRAPAALTALLDGACTGTVVIRL